MFAYRVRDPQRYGVVEFDADGKAIGLEEKPEKPRSHYAVTGLYFYDNRVLEIAAALQALAARRARDHGRQPRLPRATGELHVEVLGRGMAWLDTGTHEALLQASTFIQAIERAPGPEGGLPGGGRAQHGLRDRGGRAPPRPRACARASTASTCCGSWTATSRSGRATLLTQRVIEHRD